ncbi:MAG: MarR family transcriptional regulator [Coriobacteriia bacterium]|nr:MarR family transcriptional regulator [Coriobacteriia bacterium]
MHENLFGFPVKYEAWNKQGSLPLYIANGYDFHGIVIGKKFCIAIKPRDDLSTLPALRKQIAKIQALDNAPVILDLDSISFHRKKSFIENNIPFITQKQAFLPFMCSMLTNENEGIMEIDKFTFSAQQLFLLYIYSGKKRFYLSDASRILPFTPMTLTRASRQLEATGLFNATKDGVNKVIESKFGRAELFEKARKFLSNPVYNWGYIYKEDLTSEMVFAGETALSEKTMLNPPSLITFAIWKKSFDSSKLTDDLVDSERQVKLELWSYDPRMFSNENTADVLSLALSLEDNHDERVEGAVKELLGGRFKNG